MNIALKADLHFGNNCSKLGLFNKVKKISLKCTSLGRLLPLCKPVQADLHNGNYHSKLVHFEEHKNIFHIEKALAQCNLPLCVKTTLKAGLQYSDYYSKLVHFEAQKIIFHIKKGSSLEQYMPQCKQHMAKLF